jgi:hypothetical protein
VAAGAFSGRLGISILIQIPAARVPAYEQGLRPVSLAIFSGEDKSHAPLGVELSSRRHIESR